jgi:hypothetical protein
MKVSRIDRNTGLVSDFVAHTQNTKENIFVANGFNKPIDVRFRVDFGVSNPGTPTANSGKIWKVTHK